MPEVVYYHCPACDVQWRGTRADDACWCCTRPVVDPACRQVSYAKPRPTIVFRDTREAS